MEKSLFQILEEMNRLDTENKTQKLGVANSFVSSSLTKKGTLITMGAPPETSMDLLNGKVMPILLLIDKETYNKLK